MEKTNKELHRNFVKLGHDRRKLTNQLLAILPEIFSRKIYLKYARTIEEYAGKFGGLSKEVVKKRLRIEKYIYNKPKLRAAILTEGIHKVALVASLATVENEAIWADKIQHMSKPAVQELSKEVRYKIENGEICLGESVNMNLFGNCHGENGDVESDDRQAGDANCKTTLCSAATQRIRIDLEGELFFLFLKLKKKYGEKLTNREVMKEIFEENLGGNFQGKFKGAGGGGEKEESLEIQKNGKIREGKEAEITKINHPQSAKVVPRDGNSLGEFQHELRGGIGGDIESEKDQTINVKFTNAQSAKVVPGHAPIEASEDNFRPEKNRTINGKDDESKNHKKSPASRYISVHIRRNLLQKTAGKCSYPDCQRPAQVFHHTDRFANSHSHESLKPICKIHHEFIHNGLIQNEKEKVQEWQLQLQNGELGKIDRLYREYRKSSW